MKQIKTKFPIFFLDDSELKATFLTAGGEGTDASIDTCPIMHQQHPRHEWQMCHRYVTVPHSGHTPARP